MSLLFTDGFESLDIFDISRKWGSFASVGQSEVSKACAIVSGNDPSGKPLARKGGRSLYLASAASNPWGYFAHNFVRGIEKSRTVYVGFALRLVGSSFLRLSLGTGRGSINVPSRVPYYEELSCYGPGSGQTNVPSLRQPSISTGNITGAWREPGLHSPYVTTPYSNRNNGLVASLDLTFNKTNISCRVDFPSIDGIPSQYGTVNTNCDLYNGDFHYYQFGFTLLGNNPVAGNSSWIDFRMGNRLDKRWFQQCQTCIDGAPQSFFIDAVGLSFIPSVGCWLDDVYIANDDGDVNNDFLGSIYVRNTYVSTQGSQNDGVPQNISTGNRGDAVSARFITAGDAPFAYWKGNTPIVTGTNLSALSEDGDYPFDSSVTLENDGDNQSFLFAPIHYFGASPNIKACVLYAACVRKYADLSYPYLDAYFRYGSESSVFSRPNPRPIAGFHAVTNSYFSPLANDNGYVPTRYPEVVSFVIENNEGPESRLFNAERLNMSEFGFVLSTRVPNFIEYTPLLVRKSLYLDIVVSETLSLDPYCSRHIEEMLASSFSVSSVSVRDWGGSVDESLIFFDGSLQALGYQHLITDPLRIDDAYPEISQNVSSILPLSDSVVFSYHHYVGESFAFDDTSYGVWVEEFREIVVSVSETFNGIAVLASSDLSVIESDLFDGHLDASEDISLLSSYVWDGHETAEEYVGLSSFAQDALVEFVDSMIEYEEDHFDGFWVEQFDMRFGLSDSVLTQQWRYEWFMGVLINAWQISPVEDPGMDGYHVGDLDPEIFGDV